MYSILFKSFIRSKIAIISIVLLMGVGLISILLGKQFIQKQEKAISEAELFQKESIKRNVMYHNDDIGLLLYYLRFSLIKEPNNLTGLSIGQRDVNPSIQTVTIRGLEGQKYDTDFENPSLLLSGNLDLGFVIIYLFPLVLIALTFNLFSEEKERKTWRLIASQTASTVNFLYKKLTIRVLFLYMILIVLFLLAISILQIPINEALLAFISISVFYLAFWTSLCFLVVSFQKNSSFNALALLSVWITLTILFPAIVNNYVMNTYPVPEALRTMIEQRDGYHEKWDEAKEVTMDNFFAHYPQYKKYPVPKDKFSWLWYYGMQQMGDDESRESSKEMKEKILLRESISQTIATIIPTMHTQLMFNQITQTDLNNHMQFLDHLDKFHEELRLYFYPKIFENYLVKNEDWSKFKPKIALIQNHINWGKSIYSLLFITLLISFLTFLNLRKI
ncbi:DUF3526 domain-containing protein [Aquimarina longa]|uniref:DUF3526 domain-containing protein n=1 Tax=Aquimarina longa TaxID=1080221 RepID=UPI000785732D|nr:DUF3526 domain-containing protein [Aquimarina longa]